MKSCGVSDTMNQGNQINQSNPGSDNVTQWTERWSACDATDDAM